MTESIITRVPTQQELVTSKIMRLTEEGRTNGRARIELECYLATMTQVPNESLSLSDLVANFGRTGAHQLLRRVAERARSQGNPGAQLWEWTAASLAA